MTTNHPQEPSADIREAASALRQIYIALKNEGFTTKEALAIVGNILAATQQGNN